MKLYLAGPLFTLAEKQFNLQLKRELCAYGYDCFLPQEHEQDSIDPNVIFHSDVGGIDQCDAIVACMDGSDPDSGTCWEVGYGYAMGKIIVLYRTDVRSEGGPLGPFNLMMTQSCDAFVEARFMTTVGTLAGGINAHLRELSAPQ